MVKFYIESQNGHDEKDVSAFIGLLVVIIIAVSVVIPTVLLAISTNTDITGTTKTVLDIVPLIVVLLLVVAMIGT